jgi:hypothetical protein
MKNIIIRKSKNRLTATEICSGALGGGIGAVILVTKRFELTGLKL